MRALQEVQTLEGHSERVWSVAWSPSGDMLASCSGDKTVRIWSRVGGGETWACSAILEETHTGTIRSVSWSPSGQQLATAGFDAKTAIWQLQGGVWEQVSELEGHENEVKGVAWSPNGNLLATCGRDRSVWVWESIPGNEWEVVEVMQQGHTQDVKQVAWHPGGELLASASYDDTIKLWSSDGDEWTCVHTLGGCGTGHTSTVWSVCFDASGDCLASCSDDLTLRVWQCMQRPGGRVEWRCGATLSGYHARAIYTLHWGPVNGIIATGDGENSIQLFAQGDPAELPQAVDSMQLYAADADVAVTPSGPAASTAPWMQLACKRDAHTQDVNCVQWHPKDPTLLASAGDDCVVKIWRWQ